MRKAEYLVVDSGGFIKNAPLKDIADNIVTIHEVVDEIRDKETRQRLQVLPYEIEFKQPTSQGLRKVSEFAKKTGDYSSLSVTDLSVLAVTYDLEAEKVGFSHLKTEPVVNKTTNFYKPVKDLTKINKSDAKIAGFYNGDLNEDGCDELSENSPEREVDDFSDVCEKEVYDTFNYWREPIADIEDLNLLENEDIELLNTQQKEALELYLLSRSFLCGHEITKVDFSVFNCVSSSLDSNLHPNLYRWYSNVKSHDKLSSEEINIYKVLEHICDGIEIIEENVNKVDEISEDIDPSEDEDNGYDSDVESNEAEEEEGGDDDGWITPSNLVNKKKAFAGEVKPDEDEAVVVACMTTDFAMQNVLKQIGLNILGTDGMVIRETKTWILRCYGCYTTTPAVEKKFCPKCGNKTLKRVSVTVNRDGSQQIHISTRRPINAKGKKFSLPAPKGGKHGLNPKLTADQREAQQRVSKKAMARNNPMGEDYLAASSPFVTKDVYSKSAMLGLQGAGKGNAQVPGLYWDRKNPNAVRKNTGNRKKNTVM